VPDWLFEGRITVYLILATAALVLLYFGWQQRDRHLLVAGGIAAALISVYFLLDLWVETRGEQVRRKLAEISAAVKTRDTNRVLKHISDSFRGYGMNRAEFRGYVEEAFKGQWVDEITIWDVDFPSAGRSETEMPVNFQVKARSGMFGKEPFGHVRAIFVRDPDGEWRMQSFEVYPPAADSRSPLSLPRP
jgi:hypothetical protein